MRHWRGRNLDDDGGDGSGGDGSHGNNLKSKVNISRYRKICKKTKAIVEMRNWRLNP